MAACRREKTERKRKMGHTHASPWRRAGQPPVRRRQQLLREGGSERSSNQSRSLEAEQAAVARVPLLGKAWLSRVQKGGL